MWEIESKKYINALFFLFIIIFKGNSQKFFFSSDKDQLWLSMDLHIHSVFSDGNVWPTIRVDEARREGLDLIAITEHLEYQPHKEDIPNPDRNRSFFVATESINKGEKLKVINGSEITREMPPGHINAVFVKDANLLLHEDSLSGIKEANKQNAFVFWNHPNWDEQRIDGIARLDQFHEHLIKNKLLHGIEVVNESTYSEEALQIALENNLTILGTSDIHGIIDWEHQIPNGGHRPMTLVNVENESEKSVKSALFAGKTVVWFKDLLIGKEENLKALIKSNLVFGPLKYIKDKLIVEVELSNKSMNSFKIEYLGNYSFHQRSSIFSIPANSKIILKIKTITKKREISLPFRILNTVTAPKKTLSYTFFIK